MLAAIASRSLPLLFLSLLLGGLAHAEIVGIGVPHTIRPGDSFNVIIESVDSLQSIIDVDMAFGYASGASYQGGLGTFINSTYLGPEQSNQLHNFNESLSVPRDAALGSAFIAASLMSLIGVGQAPTLSNFNVTVTLGSETSPGYVFSD